MTLKFAKKKPSNSITIVIENSDLMDELISDSKEHDIKIEELIIQIIADTYDYDIEENEEDN